MINHEARAVNKSEFDACLDQRDCLEQHQNNTGNSTLLSATCQELLAVLNYNLSAECEVSAFFSQC